MLFVIHASIAIQVLPQVKNNDTQELIRIVDAVIAYIASTGLHYVVSPFETTVEGDFDTLMRIVKRSQEICIEEGASQVSCYIKSVYAPEKEILKIDEKISKHAH